MFGICVICWYMMVYEGVWGYVEIYEGIWRYMGVRRARCADAPVAAAVEVTPSELYHQGGMRIS